MLGYILGLQSVAHSLSPHTHQESPSLFLWCGQGYRLQIETCKASEGPGIQWQTITLIVWPALTQEVGGRSHLQWKQLQSCSRRRQMEARASVASRLLCPQFTIGDTQPLCSPFALCWPNHSYDCNIPRLQTSSSWLGLHVVQRPVGSVSICCGIPQECIGLF